MTGPGIVLTIICAVGFPCGIWEIIREGRRLAALGTPLSEEVVAHSMRQLDYAAAGIQPVRRDGLEELWEASQ